MEQIHDLLAAAWRRVRPMLERDPAELRRRLARRDSRLLTHPPRAWCLAVRANDTRLAHLSNIPPSSFRLHPSHQIWLTSEDLAELCAPVRIDPPGEPVADVARKLGTTPASLRNVRLSNLFHTRHVPILDGRAGKPHPLLYTDHPLDPSSRGLLCADPIWSITAAHLRRHLPRRINVELTRIPLFRARLPRLYRDPTNLHPEHPDVDVGVTLSERSESNGRRLPPPAPDPVPYKWKDGVYLGYDWRNPLARENYERHQRALEKSRAAVKLRRHAKPAASAAGSLQFKGYQWLCPQCRRKVSLLFLPLPRVHLLPGRIPKLPKNFTLSPCRLVPLSSPQFACQRCHHLRRPSCHAANYWNEIVTYLSAGLLYGHEVPRPRWFNPPRKKSFAPKLNRQPSRRRPQIERLLLTGLTITETAQTLGLSKGTILFYTKQIYRQNNVKCLKELLLKNGLRPRPHMRGPARGQRGEGRARSAKCAASSQAAAVSI